jgi:uncharacterized protein (DUF1778 family)
LSRTEQLQIRVTPAEKAQLKSLAERAGQGVSAYVLSRALPKARLRFEELVATLGDAEDRRFALAELNEFLTSLSRDEFLDAIGTPPVLDLSPYWRNYVAAMVELSAQQKGVPPPRWLADIEALTEPHFVAPLSSLRLHLLRASPVPFRRRNIFIDSTVGDRV